MKLALKFSYNGKDFRGYARQPQQKTIEGEIISSLVNNGFIENTNVSEFRSASRTDKGVSALGNIIAFKIDKYPNTILKVLNDDLQDIIFYGFKEVNIDFYPRHAKQRRYRYYLKNNNFDNDKIISVATSFAGEHNFSNFARIELGKDPERIIDNILIEFQNDFIVLEFSAQNFLWNQVRRIVSAISKTGLGKIEKEEVIEALHNPDKKVDFGLAPAEPLVLTDIVYDFEFEIDNLYYKSLNKLEKNIISSL